MASDRAFVAVTRDDVSVLSNERPIGQLIVPGAGCRLPLRVDHRATTRPSRASFVPDCSANQSG
eukprot:26267-Rhodomonas_salina.2